MLTLFEKYGNLLILRLVSSRISKASSENQTLEHVAPKFLSAQFHIRSCFFSAVFLTKNYSSVVS